MDNPHRSQDAPESAGALSRSGRSGVAKATGREREEWFALLDEWEAGDREYREVAEWLAGEHGLSDWWAQKLIVEYEQARGLRAPGSRSDGTFTTTVTRTMPVSVDRLFEAVVNVEERERWLPGAEMRERTARPGRSVRFDWGDGATRVNFVLVDQGPSKSQLAVEHLRLPDSSSAGEMNRHWRDRLDELKRLFEALPGDDIEGGG